jgi:ABC-type Zn2+ transport system substrate-binding protein/surface adhesin
MSDKFNLDKIRSQVINSSQEEEEEEEDEEEEEEEEEGEDDDDDEYSELLHYHCGAMSSLKFILWNLTVGQAVCTFLFTAVM